MNCRDRFHAVFDGRPFDRLPLLEWAGWWDQTVERWHGEGLPTDCRRSDDLQRHFGLDLYRRARIAAVDGDAPKPAHHGAGILADEADYDRLRKHLFQIRDEWPVAPGLWTAWSREQERGDTVLRFILDGFFWLPRVLFGIERHFYAFFDNGNLVHRMNRDNLAWMIKVVDRICDICTPDFMTFAEDMSYNHGPMLSRELFDEFMLPYYRVMVPHLKAKGIRVFVDSDGDMTEAAEWFEEAGCEGILPLERQAGVDVADLRRRYPAMRWMGHFDKRVMNRGEAAMRTEFERLLPTAAQGGFFISCDHQTPPEVSYRDYQLYLSLFREYAARASALVGT